MVAAPSPPRPAADLARLARGGTLNVLGLVISAVMQLALTVLVARGLGAGGTGAFFEAVALFTILSNVGELGADTGLVRMLSRYQALGRQQDLAATVRVALWPVSAFCLGLAVAAWLAAPPLAAALSPGHHQEVETYLRTLIPFIPVAAAATVALAGTRGMGTMAPFVWIQNVLLPSVRPVLVALAVLLGLGWLAVALSWAGPLVVALALAVTCLLRMVRRATGWAAWRKRRTPTRVVSAEFWRFARPRALAAAFGITITWLDILLVGALQQSTQQAGIYAAVSRLSVMGALALNAVGMAIAPQVSELASLRRIRDAESVFQVGTWWLMAITWPVYVTVIVFAPFVLRVFGHAFTAGQLPLIILCAAQLFNLGTGNVTVVLLMAGKSSLNLINAAASLGLNIGLNLLLIPRLGITGAAVAWAAAIICNNLAALLQVRYLLGMRPFGPGYRIVATASVACFGGIGALARLAVGDGAHGFVVAATLATAIYAVVLWRARRTLHLTSLRGAIPRRRPVPAGR